MFDKKERMRVEEVLHQEIEGLKESDEENTDKIAELIYANDRLEARVKDLELELKELRGLFQVEDIHEGKREPFNLFWDTVRLGLKAQVGDIKLYHYFKGSSPACTMAKPRKEAKKSDE